MRRQHLETLAFFLAAYLELDSKLAKLFVVALQKIADQRDEGGAQDHDQADENLHLVLAEFHCIPILGCGRRRRNSLELPFAAGTRGPRVPGTLVLFLRKPSQKQTVGSNILPVRNGLAPDAAAVAREQALQFLAPEPALP